MATKKGIGLIAGAGVGAAAAAALRRRWAERGRGSSGTRAAAPGAAGEAFLDHLAEAVRITTIGHEDPQRIDTVAFQEFHDFLRATYPRCHQHLRVETVAGYSLLYEWEGRDPAAAPILLMGHMDVVPVESGTEEDWPFGPFAGERDERYLWGRGAIDDKGAVIALFEAVEGLLAGGFQPRRTVYLAVGHDEETGGAGGAIAVAGFLAERGIRFEFVLDEGGAVVEDLLPGATRPVGLVGIGEKGYLNVELTAESAGGHSSVPPPSTAVGRLAAAVHRLEQNPMRARLPVQSAFFNAVAPALGRAQGLVLRYADRLGPLVERKLSASPASNALIRTTAAVTMIDGGVKPNVLPQQARAVANFRVLPGDDLDAVLAHVRQVVGTGISVRPLEGGFTSDPSPLSSPDSAAFEMIAATITDLFPEVVVAPWILMGATDSRHYQAIADDVYRFAPFTLTPEDMARIHGTGERVRLSDADTAVAFYRSLVERAG